MSLRAGKTASVLDGYGFAFAQVQAPAYVLGRGARLLHANAHAHRNGDPFDAKRVRQLEEWARPLAAPPGIVVCHVRDKAFEGTLMVDHSSPIDPEVPARVFAKENGFTPAQTKVFVRWMRGLSARAIAEELGCGIETVRSHVAQIRQRSGISGKFDLAEMVRRIGGR